MFLSYLSAVTVFFLAKEGSKIGDKADEVAAEAAEEDLIEDFGTGFAFDGNFDCGFNDDGLAAGFFADETKGLGALVTVRPDEVAALLFIC